MTETAALQIIRRMPEREEAIRAEEITRTFAPPKPRGMEMTETDGVIIVGCKFGYSDTVYDFLSRIPVNVGDRVRVNTKRGTAVVTVDQIKTESDMAEQFVIEVIPPEPEEPKVPEMEEGE